MTEPTDLLRGIAARYWWVLLVRGLFALIFGIIAIAAPHAALGFLVVLLGVYFLFDGIAALAAGFSSQKSGRPASWWYVQGAAGIVVAIITFVWPHATALVLAVILGIWAIIAGVGVIAAALAARARTGTAHTVGLAVFGALAVILGIILVVNPARGIVSLLWLIGVFAIVEGVVLIGASFAVRRVGQS